MRISCWAAMKRQHLGRQWHCNTTQNSPPDYAWPPRATRWLADSNRRARPWRVSGNSDPRSEYPAYGPWCLIGVLMTLRDLKKG